MSFSKIIIATLLTASFSSAYAIETTIDFEDDVFKGYYDVATGLDENGNEYEYDIFVSLGDQTVFNYKNVTFSGIGRTSNTGSFTFEAPSVTSPDYSGFVLATGKNNFTTLKLSFENSISAFSFNLGNNINNWELTAFNDSGATIDSLILNKRSALNPSNDGQFFGLSSDMANISYATLTNLGDPIIYTAENVVTIDNLKYTEVSPVPEPSTYALMLGGLGMVGFMAYRRRKTTNA